MPTYVFEGFTEANLLNASTGSSIGQGDVFTMPSATTTRFEIWDNDSNLSGDNNDNATDTYGQTATIKVNGSTVTSGRQAYVEVYHTLRDQNGNTYYLIEIEVEGHDAVGNGDDYFTFWGDTPPAGAVLTVIGTCETNCVSYCDLGTEIPQLPVLPGSIGGRLTYDDDANDNEWNAQTGNWDRGVANASVQLIGADGQVVATTTTDSYGTYKFSNVAPGDYKVKFPGQTGWQFDAQNVGSDDGSDSDADATGLTMSYTVGSNQNIWNVDAGLKNLLTDGDEASAVREDAGLVTLTNVLLNAVDPEAGEPVVYAVADGSGQPMTGNVGQQVTGSNGGLFTINADGSITFDTAGAFDALNFGESTTTSVTYCVKDAGGKIVESTYTVTVTGIEPPVVCEIEAVDDAVSVTESQDVGTAEAGAKTLNVLANDGPDAGDAVAAVKALGAGNGAPMEVGVAYTVTTEGGRTGSVTLQADGTLVWDGGDNFEELNQGQTDSFQLEYTVACSAAEMAKHNLLFVLDISNSTVGGGGGSENVFSGQNVADLNGDGLANTVLDAEINAVQAAVQKLLDQAARGEIDLTKIDIGIVTFSGIASGFTTVNAATLGTFAADDSALNAALTSIVRGGWTNYEAGLQEAEDWFASQSGDGAINKMYFLSDGRPIIGTDAQGNYVYQSLANYGDEVSAIATTYGAEIHAVGIGANSDLAYLDQIDNTGGAVKVLNTSDLSAAVTGSVEVRAEAKAIVTVTINGEDEPVVCEIEAVDDAVSVTESQDVGTAEAGAKTLNVLANDGPDAGDAVAAVKALGAGNGAPMEVGVAYTVTTEGGRTGSVTLQADGTLVWDGGDNFEELAQGQTDSFQLEYTVACSASEMAKHNLLFVLDISNSTVGGGGGSENVFAGQNVADLNGDGLSNTVLDAEINAVQAAVQKLLDQAARGEIDLTKIDIGIVTFSGIASGFTTVNAATLGTFAADDAALNAALTSIVRGGWTNYEAGLQEAEDWFASQSGDGAINKMYFLSDGRPIIGTDSQGNYVYQGLANYGDEVSAIATTYGAEIHAVGIGANSDLAYLDQIDNTGGAVQVLNTSDLSAAVTGSVEVRAEAKAIVTVTINGEDEPVVLSLDAIDDSFRVGEAEGVSQANLITGAYLAAQGGDDNPQGDTIDGVVATDADLLASIRLTNVEVAGGYDGSGNATGFTDPDANVGGGTFTVTTSGGRTGEITVGEDGSFTFTLVPGDADPEFISGQTDTVQLRYTVERVVTPASVETQVLDFTTLPAGTFVSSQYDGVTVTAVRASGVGGNQAMVFNAAAPTGGDTDLAAPGQGGVLIISENGNAGNPDDNAGGGTFTFTFAQPRTVDSLTFLDTEEPTPVLRFYDASGALITTMNGPVTTDGGLAKDFPIGVDGVARMEVVLAGSGALDDLRLTRETPAVVLTDTAIVTVVIDGEGNPDLLPLARADAASIGETETAAISILDNDDKGDAPYTVKSITYTDAAGASQTVVVGAGGVTVTAQGTAIVNGAAATVTGTLTVGDDGALTFVLDEASKTLLEDDETAALTLSYTGEDADGDETSATVTVTIAGDDLQPQAEDNAYLTNEGSAVSGNLITDLGAPLGDSGLGVGPVDVGGDGGVAALTVVSINVGGTSYDVPAGGSVTVDGVASASGTYTGKLTVNSDGSMSFEPTGFGGMNLNDPEETVTFTYTIKDADDDLSTADVEITVTGLDDDGGGGGGGGQSLLVKGTVNGQQDIVFLLDFTAQTRTVTPIALNEVGDVNGDGFFNSVVDDMLRAVIDVARDLVTAGRPAQPLSLIAFASTALTPLTLAAQTIVDAFGTSGYALAAGTTNPFADLGKLAGTYFDADSSVIDLDAALSAANSLITDPAANNKVYLIASNEDFLDDGVDGSNEFVGDPVLSDLQGKADVDAVLYFRDSILASGDPLETLNIFNQIDEDGVAGVALQLPTAIVGLEANPQSSDLSDLIDAPLLPEDPALGDIALVEITAGGVTQSASFGPGANTAQVSVGGVTFPGLGADAEVDVKITFTDGSTQEFDNVRDYDDSNDTFDFNLSLL